MDRLLRCGHTWHYNIEMYLTNYIALSVTTLWLTFFLNYSCYIYYSIVLLYITWGTFIHYRWKRKRNGKHYHTALKY